MGRKRVGGRRMRREEGDGDEAISVVSIETRETIMSDGEDFYDGYSNDLDDEQQIDEAIENLTEESPRKADQLLLQYMAPEDVKDRQGRAMTGSLLLNFLNNVFGCLRKLAEAEILLGSRILTILAIISGGYEERFFSAI
ncbi:hypothetical protein PsorP6_010172 [Peronosclerospora sorghi]|uniref:Uncharacterized protein n=1 Tax=Peronosclerospora sorghi TaxID=230839 RepID=A0ACC0VU20_9STRA|nr:hypothetical protein PsorP6_010172 [Peronosclerospora sorghi]